MLPKLDREMAVALSRKISEQLNFTFIDLNDVHGTLEKLSKDTLLTVIHCICKSQRENLQQPAWASEFTT